MATQADFKRIGNYARMYNPDQKIDRRKASRSVPMQVICPGYSRTGTLTMQKALTILGYTSPYHFSSFYDNVGECDLWVEAMKAKYYGIGKMPDKAFFDGLLGHVGAVTDSPCNLFTKELVDLYPDAKVVLVERNIDSWYKSWISFCERTSDPILPVVSLLDPGLTGKISSVGYMIVSIQSGFTKTLDEVRVRCKDAYRRHYRDVRDFVPKDRMLEFKLEDGWAPLCEFLGKEIPVCVVVMLHVQKHCSERTNADHVGCCVSTRE